MFDKLVYKYKDIIYWIKIHKTKEFRHFLKVCLSSYPYDYSYLYKIEKAKLEEMSKYIKKHNRFVGCEKIVRDINLAIKMLDIIMNADNLYHYNGDLTFEEITEGEYKGEYEVKKSDGFEYVCDINVNLKNINRFIDKHNVEEIKKHPHILYCIKAKYLYHKIRLEHEEEWWD